MPIDPPRGLDALLGAFAPARAARAERSSRSAKAQSPASTPTREDAEADLRRIAEGLDTADAESIARARLQAVRVLLRRELGARVREYPEWTSLVDRVAHAIEATPEVDARLIEWIASLKGASAL